MPRKNFRNMGISIFVALWLMAFHYESIRGYFLDPIFAPSLGRNLPKIKFLFPPAGWVMFYQVDDSFGYTEIYGVKDGNLQWIDPHHIIRTRDIVYDNIKRNVLATFGHPQYQDAVCQFLRRKFLYFDGFVVMNKVYPSLTREPHQKYGAVAYVCR